MEWTTRAACRGWVSPEWDGDDLTDATAMRCQGCSVRLECLSVALARGSKVDVGIWGGTTVKTRDAVRRKQMTVAEAWERLECRAELAERRLDRRVGVWEPRS